MMMVVWHFANLIITYSMGPTFSVNQSHRMDCQVNTNDLLILDVVIM